MGHYVFASYVANLRASIMRFDLDVCSNGLQRLSSCECLLLGLFSGEKLALGTFSKNWEGSRGDCFMKSRHQLP